MSLPDCYGKYDGEHPVCVFQCRFRTGCGMNAISGKGGAAPRPVPRNTNRQREEQGRPRLRVNAETPKPQLMKYAAMEPQMAVQWGVYMYRRTLEAIPPLNLAEEYEFLEKERDAYLKEKRIELLREEVERRRLWDDWNSFLQWVVS